jgi:hypothetical protein
VRFQKKRDVGKALQRAAVGLLRTVLVAGIGGFIAHRWHVARQQREDLATNTRDDNSPVHSYHRHAKGKERDAAAAFGHAKERQLVAAYTARGS